jgi:serine protein kinase
METTKKLTLPNQAWKGSFRDLLPRIKEFPALAESSHSRLHRLIEREGVDEIRSAAVQRIYGRESLQALKAFRNFHGIEVPLYTIQQEYLLPARMGAEASKQAMVLIGPPGSGKSDWTNTVKALMRKAEPIPYNGQCPIHDHPLSLLYMVPTLAERHADAKGGEDFLADLHAEQLAILESLGLDKLVDINSAVKEILARNGVSDLNLRGIAQLPADDLVSAIVYGLGLPKSTRNVVGPPCPFCQALVLGEYINPGVEVPLAEFPIQSMRFSTDFQGSCGIEDVPEVQPLNFDIASWVGSENLGLMGKVNPPDPRCVLLNGAFNKGNRGLVILTEGLKNPPEAQRILLEALQGRRVGLPSPLTGSVFFDGVIMINSNEGEYVKFINDKVNEPYVDRFWRIYFPYPLERSEAEKVDRKLWNSSEFAKPVEEGGVHIEPLVWPYLSRLEILTRIEDDDAVDRNIKVDAYDGRDIRNKGMSTKVTVEDLRARASWREGLEGISPREVAKILNAVAGESIGHGNCVTSKVLRNKLAAWFKVNVQDEKRRERLMGFLGKELDEARSKEAQKIVIASLIESFEEECQKQWERYLDNVRAYLSGKSVKSSYGSNFGRADEDFLRKVESSPDYGVSSAQADRHRGEVMRAVTDYLAANPGAKRIPWDIHDASKGCIRDLVLSQVQNAARLFGSASARTSEDSKKLAAALERLVARGFCAHCADELLNEAQETQLWKYQK